MSSFWSKVKGFFSKEEAKPDPFEDVKWLKAGTPENPFDQDILNLMSVAFGLVAASEDERCATRAVGWGRDLNYDFDCSALDALAPVSCQLSYPCAESLPEGLLFVPESMDQKWVIGYQKNRVILARSWTGDVAAFAEAKKTGETLQLSKLRVLPGTGLDFYGSPERTFEWVIRSHVFGQKIPIQANDEAIDLIEKSPQITFSHFGKMLFCLSREWKPPKIEHPLRSDGALLQAFRNRQISEMKEVLDGGADINAPLSFHGYTLLHVAMIEGQKDIIEFLLENKADVNALDDHRGAPLGVGIVHGAPLHTLKLLVNQGADIRAANEDGFNYLHASAEVNREETIHWLLEQGLDIHSSTKRGLSPLHISAALGHGEVTRALLKAGADARAKSPLGTPLEIAKNERKSVTITILEEHLQGQ